MTKVLLLFNSILAEIRYKREEKKQAKYLNTKRHIDRLLDKINEVGYDGLDENEKKDSKLNENYDQIIVKSDSVCS